MTTIIDNHDQVAARLAQLGLTRACLLSAVRAGEVGASLSTALHPPSDEGFRRWSDTVAGLRRSTLGLNWEYSNKMNFCTIYNRKTSIAVAVMSGDVLTGSREGSPRSRYPKGYATSRRLTRNRYLQYSLLPDIKTANEVVEDDCTLWVLVQYAGTDGLQLELSWPIEQDDSGYIVEWRERILLPDLPTDFAPSLDSNGENEPDVDFNVEVL